MNIQSRIETIRGYMAEAGVRGYIITGFDPHGSEIPPAHWHTREWISGFTGSAGLVLITADAAGLWTDFRYWIQAEEELKSSGIALFRDGMPGVPEPLDWLVSRLSPGDTIAFDGCTVSSQMAYEWLLTLMNGDLRFNASLDFIANSWLSRPPMPAERVFELSKDVSGESRESRLARVREKLRELRCDTWIASALDLIAWTLNIRGSDIPDVPAAVGYLIVQTDSIRWFTNIARLPDSLRKTLERDGITILPYENFETRSLPPESRIFIDPRLLNYAITANLPSGIKQRIGRDPVYLMKSRKNETEIAHIRRAMEKDGAALVRFYTRLARILEDGEKIGEMEAAERLRECRQSLPGFLGDSFTAIAAVGGNGAVCHYHAKPESQGIITAGEGLFLLDSGAQWEDGTTDITRTTPCRKPTAEEIRDYTRVLKAHITVSRMRFPAGSRGYQIDAIARADMWHYGIDYGHGTGHGVGYRLGVHEGPQVLNSRPVDVVLEPGMIVSNEPGLYRENCYGIRIENLVVCREAETTEFGQFLCFETLSLAPYCRALIDVNLLSKEEIHWINDYHAQVWKRLYPLLTEEEADWLHKETQTLEVCAV
ncbi:MAG: hypothetical protein B0D92_08390 [Spirochaeta sp. LUC14_002_19_P3]|nr:MAG: hypothetical protein B0D92_08390 [Spirochaeta sp. LUC14_002_19_P3]